MKVIFIFFVLIYSSVSAIVVNSIVINGNERVDKDIIETHLNIKKGMNYENKNLNDIIKSLYETGLFEKVDITNNNGRLVVNVVENPLISEIIFEGNDVFDEKSLTNEITTKRKSIFNKNKINIDIKRILNLYKRGGKFNAKIEPQIIKEDANRVKLIFKIIEGDTTRVKDITIIGNKKFGKSDLKNNIRSHEYKWYKFGLGSKFDPDGAEIDKELLRRFYFSNGYPDFEVVSVNSDIDIDGKWVYLTFLINEGEKYRFGNVDIYNNIKDVNSKNLLEQIKIKKGKIFSSELLQESMDRINKELAREGFVFVEIIPDIKKNEEEKTMDVNFIIQESPRIYIGEIKIIGNTRTYDEIIRKELRFGEGDPLNMTNYNRSIELLYGTGYFSKVDIKKEETDTPDKLNLIVEVSERRTGEVSFAVTYSTTDGMSANIGISENNLLGRGQSLGLNFTLAQYSRNISLNYGKPNFMGRDLFAGVSVFYNFDKDKDTVNFDEGRIGGKIYTIYSVTDYIKQQWFYNIYREKIENVSSSYQGIIKETNSITSSIGQTLSFDSRDNRMNPESGWYFAWTSELAGIGGDNNYLRNTFVLSNYISIVPSYLALKIGGYAGIVNSNSQEIGPTKSFFLDNSKLRGFKYGGIGPRKISSNNAIGGKEYYVVVGELKIPILPKEYGLSAGLFINAGTLTKTDVVGTTSCPLSDCVDSGSIRSSTGVTLYWTTPMGILNLTFSKILKREVYDKPEEVAFSFGTQF